VVPIIFKTLRRAVARKFIPWSDRDGQTNKKPPSTKL